MRRVRSFIIFLSYSIFIFILSSIPGKDIPSQASNYSLIFHFILYFFYGFVIYLFFRSHVNSILFGVIFALTDEIHQYFVPGRSCDPVDFLVDSIAIILSIFVTKRLSEKDTFSIIFEFK